MNARFVAACARPVDLPDVDLDEIAIAGRSNCGKSSLINALVGQRKLARTSSSPGRTRQIVFFAVEPPSGPGFHLVDLPGYGFARVSRREAASWAPLIEGYVEQRRQLVGMLLLIDVRRAVEQEERDLLRWCRELRGIEPLVVLTKADKLPKNQRMGAVEAARSALGLKRRPHLVSVREPASVERLQRVVLRLAVPEPAVARPPLVIGLTGGIGAGKSEVARMLGELGAPVVDADQLARQVVAPGTPTLARVVEAFGEEVLDAAGALDRSRLGQRVFADAEARARLEAITHPAIVEAAQARFAELGAAHPTIAASGGAALIVYEAALLVETGRHRELGGPLVVVVADDELRLARLVARDGISEEQARERIEAQLPQQRKAELADYVIDNSGTMAETRAHVARLWQALQPNTSTR